MNLVHLCTDAHSLHQFVLSAVAMTTGRGNGGEQKGEELPLYVNVKIPLRRWESELVSSVTMSNNDNKKISALF